MQTPNRKRAADVGPIAPEAPTAIGPHTVLELDEVSPDGRRRYKGSFTFKVPSLGDRVDIAALKAQYMQQLRNMDSEGTSVAEMIAYLVTTIDHDKAPSWWRDSKHGLDLYDFAPVIALYAKARAYEATFLGGVAEPAADATAATERPGAADQGDVVGDVPPAPVRREVIATLGARGSGAGDPDSGAPDEPLDRNG